MTIFELAWGYEVAGDIRTGSRFFRNYADAVKAAGEIGCTVDRTCILDADTTLTYNGEYAGSISAHNLE